MNMINFLRSHPKLVKLVVWLFVIGMVAGGAAAFVYPELMEQIAQSFSDRFQDTPNLDANLAQAIFLNNLMVSATAWIGGLILVGLAPILIVFINGFIIGYVILFYLISFGFNLDSLLFLAFSLVPHGIFEIPAFLTAAVLGLRLGWGWLAPDARGQRWPVFKQSVKETVKWFAVLTIILIIAAWVEVFISGKIVTN